MSEAPARRRAPLLARLSLAAAPLVVAFLGAEVMLRKHVPYCGASPFRASEIPGLTYELKASFTTLYKGQNSETNSAGFRGPEFAEPGSGVRRIAFVGDSVTFGNAIAYDDTFPAMLEARWRERGEKSVALNCGVPGFSIENVAIGLERRVLPLRPDVVVYVFVFNDVEVNTLSGNIPADARIDTLSEYPLRSATLQFLGMRGRAITRSIFGEQSSGWVGHILRSFEEGGRDRLRLGIERMRAACEAAGVQFHVAIYPHLLPFDKNPFRVIDEAAILQCGESKVHCIDLVTAFEPNEDVSRYWASIFDSHPNRAANHKVAALLDRELK